MNEMQRRKQEREEQARVDEQAFHATGQRNALGGYIGCDGPECWALIKQIEQDNFGHKIQGVG